MSNPDVVVVGAGFAGLSAALGLCDAGLEVVVLEARDRLGGRVWSVRLSNGAVAELGGEWVFGSYEALPSLANRFGLGLVPTGVDWARREAVGDLAASIEDQEAFARRAEAVLAAMGPDEVAAATLADFLDGLDAPASQLATARARFQGISAIELGHVALREATSEAGFFPGIGPCFRLARGNQALAEAMGAEAGTARLGRVVTAVEEAGDRVAVHADVGGESETTIARAAVIALPAPLVPRVAFDPQLAPPMLEALAALPFGVAAKLAVPTVDAPPTLARQSVDAPIWCWTALGDEGEGRRCVTSFAGSADGLAAADPDDPVRWPARIAAMMPEVVLEAGGRVHAWDSDPFAAGAYSAFDNASFERLDELAPMRGRLAFAGEHTAGPGWHGTMEGALRSGIRAAGEVLERLARD